MELTLEQLKAIRDGIPGTVVIYRVQEDGVVPLLYTEDVPSFSGLTEVEYQALYGDDALPVVAKEDMPELQRIVAEVLDGSGDRELTYRTYHKTRGFVWTHVRLRLVGTYEGSPVILGLFTDVTAELEIQNVLLDNTDREIYVFERDTHDLLYANAKAASEKGGVPGLDETCFHYLHGYDKPCADCIMDLITGDEPIESEWRDQGHDRFYELRAVPITFFGKKACAVFFNDQTFHVRMERALKDEHDRYLAAMEGAGIRAYEYDIRTHHIHLPAYSAALFGVSEEVDDIPESVLPLFHEEDWDGVREFFAKVDAGEPSVTEEFLMKPVDGYAARLRYTFTVVRDEDGKPVKGYAVAEDVTAVRQEELRYQRAVGEMIDVNPHALCAFELNLTRNTCSAGHGTSAFVQKALASDTADGVFWNLHALVTDLDDLEKCRKLFDRTYLIKQLEEGHDRLSLEYRRMSETKRSGWVATFISMARNPTTGDAEAVILSEDIDDRKNDENAQRIVTKTGYDYIAFIDPAKETFDFREISALVPEAYHDSFHARGSIRAYDEILQRSARIWVHPDDWESFLKNSSLDRIVSKLDEDGHYDFSIRGQRGDLILRKQLQYAYLDSTRSLIVAWQIDVTDTFRKEQEDARVLKEALEAAEHANAAKSEFLSSVSHDMRTPLNGIMGFTDIALREEDVQLKQEYLGKIRTSSVILKEIVDDTLDLSKIESGKYTLQPKVWESHRLLDEVDTSIKAAADAKGVRFIEDWSHARDSLVRIDRLAEQKVVLNLLTNAVKFTPAGGTVKLSVEDIDPMPDGCNARLTVEDTGIGMDPEFLPSAFEPFIQEHAGGSGTGLGLSIAKRLVELMGGHIDVRSKLGDGTTFSVYLPVEWLSDEEISEGEKPEQGSKDLLASAQFTGRHVLLVEDNEMNTEIARILLEQRGMDVICAADGKQGVEAFQASEEGTIDIILMDIRMPVMDGYAATRAIRQLDRPDARTVPIIAMTADAYEGDVKRAHDAGMDAHLSKPIDVAAFVETIANALNGRA